jgi:hypothetical protein
VDRAGRGRYFNRGLEMRDPCVLMRREGRKDGGGLRGGISIFPTFFSNEKIVGESKRGR